MKSEIKKPTAKSTKSTKKRSRKEETYRLTPKGIFDTCMMDIFNIDFDDRRISLAWELFESRMRKNGYVSEE